MAAWRETVYNVHNNLISLTVKEDGTVVDLVTNGVTRMILRLFKATSKANSGGETLDSDDLGTGPGNGFDWATRGASGIVDLMVGGAGVAAGDYRAYLIIYDPDHATGQVWPEFAMTFVDVINP